jgi:hypothetical protein
MNKHSLSSLRNDLSYDVFNFIQPSIKKKFKSTCANKKLLQLSQIFTKRVKEIEKINLDLNLQLKSMDSKNLMDFSTFIYYENIVSLTLDFNCNYIEDTGVYYLCEALACINYLQKLKLNFNSNRLTTMGVCYISTVLKKFVTLEVFNLDLSCNDVTPEGANLLSNALSRLKSLRSLSLILQFSQIEDEGVKYLGESLKTLDKLVSITLYLSVNKIKEYETLIDSISCLSRLRYIKLDLYNNLIETNSNKFLQIIKTKTLKSVNVNLGKNMIRSIPENDLKKIVRIESELFLSGNPIFSEEEVYV